MAITQFSHQPSKIAKSIRRKKGPASTSTLHANSRDARRLNRSSLRDEKLYRHALARDKANEKYLRRVEFFQEAVSAAVSAAGESEPNTGSEFDVDLMHRLAAAYMSRHDEELSQLGSARRAGRSASSREVALRGVVQEETEELRGGFWMPDLREEGTVENLKAWDGGWSSLGRMRFVRVADDGKGGIGARESRFPPNGLS